LKKVRLFLVLALLLALWGQVLPSHGQVCSTQKGYFVASLDSTIDAGASDFLASSVQSAEQSCAGHFVFVLNTFGGDGGSMDQMVKAISSYQGWGGSFTTLIAPPGSHAFSAGAFISEASNKIYMVNETTIGSATPIVSGIPTGEENTTLRKDINGFATYMESLASGFGRNTTAARLMVTQGVSYDENRALRLHVIDGVLNARALDAALSLLGVPPGTQVATPGVRSQFLSLVSDPNISGLLFLVGVFAVLADIYHPTLVLSVVGIAVIALALLGLGVFGASPLSIAFMILGAAFIFLEVKTQHGVSALIGVIIFAIGFVLIFEGIRLPSAPSSTQLYGIPIISYILLGALGGLVVVGSLYLFRIREGLSRRPRHFDMDRMVCKEGTMKSDLLLNGRGVANIGSEEWTVESAEAIPKGTRIKVKGISGLALIVEKSER
jgi:membrane-bound serine protease (ClpP class)